MINVHIHSILLFRMKFHALRMLVKDSVERLGDRSSVTLKLIQIRFSTNSQSRSCYIRLVEATPIEIIGQVWSPRVVCLACVLMIVLWQRLISAPGTSSASCNSLWYEITVHYLISSGWT